MKKIVRIVWISILTGMAFLVACTCQNKLPKSERKQLEHERDSIVAEMSKHTNSPTTEDDVLYVLLKTKQREYEQWQRIYEIDTLLGNEQASSKSKSTMDVLKLQIKELKNQVFMTVYGPPQ